MFVFDNSEDLDIATYEYRIYQANQVEADPANAGYYRLIGNVSINSGTITPYRQGFNLANVFTISVENSTTTSTTSTTSAVSYYGAIRAIDTSGNAGPWTLIEKTSTDTPLIDQQFIGSLTAAKITTGTIGAAEITLNGANSIIKSSGYDPGLAGWKIAGNGDAEFNQLTVRTALDIGGSTTPSSSFHVDIDGNLWLGASTYGSAPFRISNTGNVDVGGDDAFSFHVDVDGNIWSGASIANKATAPFRVSNTGQLTASSVTITNPVVTTPAITGGSITGTSLDVGTGTSSFHVDATGRIWSGNAVFASGPFSVTATGVLTATGATITGAINATSGTINNTLAVGTSGNKINIVGTATASSTAIYSGTSSYGSGGFWLDASGRFSLGTGLTWDGATLTITGTLQVGDVEIGNDVGPGTGHYGISLSTSNFNNIFLRRNDGVYFFRVGNGGTNSITWDSSSGTLNVTGAITATSGTFNGRLQAGDIYIPNTTSPVFKVTTGGAVTATSGTIGGWTLSPTTLTASYDSGGAFSTTGSMTLSNDGSLTSTYVNNGIFSTTNTTVKINDYSLSGQGSITVEGNASGSNSKFLYASTGQQSISDSRLKNVIDSTIDGIGIINNVEVVRFTYKSDENKKEHIGFIAQQVYEHIPEAAFPGGEDEKVHPWMMSKENLIPYLARSIQQLSEKVDELESRLI